MEAQAAAIGNLLATLHLVYSTPFPLEVCPCWAHLSGNSFYEKIALTVLAALMLGTACAGELEDGAAAYLRKDYVKAANLLPTSALTGEKRAQGLLGNMYDNGKGVLQARRWLNVDTVMTRQ